jgi:hypothetical protein
VHLIKVGIAEFIQRTLAAADRCHYAAVCMIVARSADKPDLLGAIDRQWESLHSACGPLIAIACPRPGLSLDTQAVQSPSRALRGHLRVEQIEPC